MNKIAEELGISANTLSNWKRDYLKDKENSFPGKGYQKPDDAELTKLRKQLFRVTQERYIKKSHRCIHKTRGVTYDFIRRNNREYSVGLICRTLGISRSAYYHYISEKNRSKRSIENAVLLEKIRTIRSDRMSESTVPD